MTVHFSVLTPFCVQSQRPCFDIFVSSVQEYKLSADLNRIEPKKTYSGMCTIPYNVECNVECNVE